MTQSNLYQFLIEQPDGGRRLDEFCASRFGSLSRMRIATLIEAGACLVNGEIERAGYRILTGDSVQFSLEPGGPTAMSPERVPVEIIHEDEHLVVVVKPAGMLVHPTMSVKNGTLLNALAYHLNRSRIEAGGWPIETLDPASEASIKNLGASVGDSHPIVRPGLVHRLDRATSGLMIIAKTQRALATLSRHFRKRLIEKRYLAWVHGIVEPEAGLMNQPIGRDPDLRPRWRVMESGKPAETRFTVLKRERRVTLLELEPVTGRTNQLRIHCAHIGHPIVGDEMHEDFDFRISHCDLKNETAIEAQHFDIQNLQSETRGSQCEIRLCLHASKLGFHHPASGEWLEFTSPAPDDIDKALEPYRRAF